LSDRFYKNKRNVKKVKKTFKCGLRICEAEAMDKIADNLEEETRWHNSKTL